MDLDGTFADNEPAASNSPVPCSTTNVQELIAAYKPIVVPECPVTTINVDGGETRLIISKLVLENFKSYGAHVEMSGLCKNFNCVIGDNGSGKSNVIDALLFVFGYRSSRIRCKRITELIHTSPLLLNVPFCRVEVHFALIHDVDAYSTNCETVPGSEFTISRTARRDNVSTYHINGHIAHHSDVVKLLASHGVDMKHNRFLILQGEVEQISLMPPKATSAHDEGLLEYLEDIIGSSRFKGPLKVVEERMEHLNEVRREKVTQLKVQEKKVKALQVVRNQALDYLRLCNRLMLIRSISCHQFLWKSQDEEDTAMTDRKLAEEQLNNLRARKQVLDTEYKKASVEMKSMQKSLEKLKAVQEEQQTAYHRAEMEDVRLRDEFRHMRANISTLKKVLVVAEKKIEEFNTVPEHTTAALQKLEEQLQKLQQEKSQEETRYQRAIQNFRQLTEPLSKEKETQERALNAAQERVNDESRQLELVRSKLDILFAPHKKATLRLNELKERCESDEQGLKSHESRLQTLMSELQQAEEKVRELTEQAALACRSEEEMRRETETKWTRIVEAKSALSKAEDRQTQNRVLRALLEQRRLGVIPGVFGRLGDLGCIEEVYDVAVSTACTALDHILVDNLDTAQACVLFLKRERLGEATFIALDKMEVWRPQMERPPEKLPCAGAQRLFDLLHISEARFRPAFYYATRETLVARDSTQATEWAFHSSGTQKRRWRVVSLQGMLIDISGAVSGGGQQTRRGKMRFKVLGALDEDSEQVATYSLQEISSWEAELQVLRNNYRLLIDSRANAEENLSRGQRHLAHLQSAMSDLQTEKHRLSQDLVSSRAALATATKRMQETKVNSENANELQEMFPIYERNLEEALALANEVQSRVEALANQLEAKWQDLSTAPKARLDLVEESLRETMEKKAKLTAALNQAQRNLAKAQEQKRTKEVQVEGEKARLRQVQDALDVLAEEAVQHATACKAAEDEIQAVKIGMGERANQVEVINTQFVDLNREASETKHRIQEARSKESIATQQVQRWARELAHLSFTPLDEEGESDSDDDDDETHPIREQDTGEREEDEEQDQSGCQTHIGRSLKQQLRGVSASLVTFLRQKCAHVSSQAPVPTFTREELRDVTVGAGDLSWVEAQLANARPHLGALEDYRVRKAAYLECAAEAKALDELCTSHVQMQATYRRDRLREFLFGFQQITDAVKQTYQTVTNGGDAELELVDSLDPFSEGVVFSVRPPDKSWKLLSNLSGGEKTLSSLSLVLALHRFRPTPLYVMDEVDAALDYRNTSIIAQYLEQRTRNAQFLIISLRPYMFEKAHHVVGVLKKFYSSSFTEFEPRRGIQNSFTERKLKMPSTSPKAPLACSSSCPAPPGMPQPLTKIMSTIPMEVPPTPILERLYLLQQNRLRRSDTSESAKRAKWDTRTVMVSRDLDEMDSRPVT